MSQVHIITGSERRRRWSKQQKRAIVAAAFAPGAAAPSIEVAFTGRSHVHIPASIPPDLAAAVIKALIGR